MQAVRCFASAMQSASLARLPGAAMLAAAAILGWPGLATAAAPAENKTVKNEKVKDEKPPEPEDLVLQTDDDLELNLTYYRGTKGKQTIPVVLLHGWKQNRNDYKDISLVLQTQGHAVIVPDLRGHGESTHRKGARKDEPLKATNMPPAQFAAMVTKDMNAVKTFIWERNNAAELNIDKLCVVGAEMGASVAVNFALADARDQDDNRVARSDYQLGRFVKALVLISPEHVFHGLPIRAVAAKAIPDVAVLILVGKQDGRALKEAAQINGMFERYHPEPTGDDKIDKKTLFFGKLDTSLQGTNLLDPKFGVATLIADFIYRRLIKSEESRDWSWRERKVPHG